MQRKIHTLIDTDAVDERTLEPVVKLLLTTGALVLMWALVSNLPGIDAVIPATAVTYGAVLGATMTLGIVAVLTVLAVRIEPLVGQSVVGPSDLVADVASIAKHVVLFVAVITAHSGFAPLVVPSLRFVGLVWTYDVLFFVLALVPTAIIAIRMYSNLDEVASLVTGRLASSEDERQGDGSDQTTMG